MVGVVPKMVGVVPSMVGVVPKVVGAVPSMVGVVRGPMDLGALREHPHGARTASDILVAAQKTGRSRPSPQEPREVCPKGCKQGMPYFPLHFEVD